MKESLLAYKLCALTFAISSYSPLKLSFCMLLMEIASYIVYGLNWDICYIYFLSFYTCFEILLFQIALKLQELSTKKQILWQFSRYFTKKSA